MELVNLFILILAIILLGFLMIKAVRWSRKVNQELEKNGNASQEKIVEQAIKKGGLKQAAKNYFAASLAKSEAFSGKALAITVIAVVTAFLLVVAYGLLVRM